MNHPSSPSAPNHISNQRNIARRGNRCGIVGAVTAAVTVTDPATGDLLADVTTPATTTGPGAYATPPGQQSSSPGYTHYPTRHFTANMSTPNPGCAK